MSALNRAIKAVGSARKLSIALGVTSMTVSHWKNRDNGIVPPSYIFSIFYLTGVTPHELRPDLYPNPTDGLPKQEP
ncbi:TPA: helix-turn-helix domain-containing protein [Enterobacter ludwigii]|jgi:DNA-binding transcriptional regulator YdaS (Cro superfamily)|uniref:transcriptional regulator n=1 Tax=Enterobacter cloacae complex TaxID=354276 RepID=UPI0005CFB7F5|nr:MULTISPECIES: YdaS family helix-turn-helix protein [Enterobacter cloacae complex]EKS7197929.1 helix-turn-helix domain-containing protein [Enterobacter ludwigii]ELV2797439.1 helix-turn-helix domain-containing protein [Enterobacter ludwigii]MCM2488942.1 helix-turn-helix domain-containing protein [Enterobacter cloacae]MED5737013.1 YdaS family helix-turn-helix protein [Enterobacter ludwigii]RTN61071.1 Rha family transcriptional regulator [Enterobacter ludwigii]